MGARLTSGGSIDSGFEGSHPPVPYIRRQLPFALILGSVLFPTLPLTWLGLQFMGTGPGGAAATWTHQLYVAVFNITHFTITFTIYFQVVNIRYFGASWKNRLVYYGVPAFAFVGLALFNALDVGAAAPAFGLFVLLAIRMFDFFHYGRQAFGVLQLAKGSAARALPPWSRTAENGFFMAVTALLFMTFISPGFVFDPSNAATRLLLVLGGSLLAAIGWAWGAAWRASGRTLPIGHAVAYLAASLVSSAIGIYYTGLYATLAIHYVEYHVLMAPRCFSQPLDPSATPDRWFARLRANPAVFYGLLLGTGATWLALHRWALVMPTDATMGTRLVVHSLDGLFVTHYFLDMFIWKFSVPHYRSTIGPLYFPRPAPIAGAAA